MAKNANKKAPRYATRGASRYRSAEARAGDRKLGRLGETATGAAPLGREKPCPNWEIC